MISPEMSRQGLFLHYSRSCSDEFFGHQEVTENLKKIFQFFDRMAHAKLRELQNEALEAFRKQGVTFNVYSDVQGEEKIFPFDLIPRIIEHAIWEHLEKGLIQRVMALNLFLDDVYGKQRIITDGVIPEEIVVTSRGYLPQLKGIRPPGGVYIHVAGIDLIREHAFFMVLEDNLKVPSGCSYVLENRKMMKRLFPEILSQIPLREVDEYPLRLRHAFESLMPSRGEHPCMVVLTPGPCNAAYFEHLFLAHQMGCPLVQSSDLVVEADEVYLKTNRHNKRIDIIYRRVDDEYLDPEVFNPESVVGVPGLMRAYRAGKILIANAPGNGVADDKAVYPFVPSMIKYYLAEEPLLPQVDTYSCLNSQQRRYVLENLSSLVVKAVDEAGGYGVVIGPQAPIETLNKLRLEIEKCPRRYIAQPLKQLSNCPTLTDDGIYPRRVDLRPYIVSGKSSWVLPGGLTRVALKEHSFVVNSSQGGGSKDTWVLGAP
jgi:uncharacterized circularly permuted ATP-grasp superfamily protein